MDNLTSTTTTPANPTASSERITWIPIIIGIGLVIAIVGIATFLLLSRDPNADQNKIQLDAHTATDETTTSSTNKGSITLIKSLPIDLKLLPFTTEPLSEYDRPYFDFGFQIAANSVSSARRNPQPTFIAPLGTKVYSLIDGVVINVPQLYSGDYSIHIASDERSNYIYETEHVIKPVVKVGDRVTAGQVIAEVSDYDARNYSGYGLVEMGILVGGNPPVHICPFQYLDPSVKEKIQTELRGFYQAWNEFKGQQVYDQNLELPGCLTTEEIPG